MRAVQKDFENIGATGCYFLSILYIAEQITASYIDAYQAYLKAIQAGSMTADCYVVNPAALMQMLTGMKWTISKEARDYVSLPEEKVVLRYERIDTLQTIGHFVVAADDGSVAYDPYGASKTVRSGTLVSKRVFRRI